MAMVLERILILALSVSLSACELVSISKEVSYHGDNRALPEQKINAIELGKTNRAWIEKHMGPADSMVKSGEAVTLKYHFSEKVKERFRIFLLFQYSSADDRLRTLYIRTEADKVTKVWLEGDDLFEPIEYRSE